MSGIKEPTINGRPVIEYPAGFKGERIVFADIADAREYREMYYLHLYVSPFGEDRAPWGHDDANVPKLHPDDPDVNPFFSPTLRGKKTKKAGR